VIACTIDAQLQPGLADALRKPLASLQMRRAECWTAHPALDCCTDLSQPVEIFLKPLWMDAQFSHFFN
jgi:hypothetical protein